MGIAYTIRIRDRISRRLSLLLTHENCANKCVFRVYITGYYIYHIYKIIIYCIHIFSEEKKATREIGSLLLNFIHIFCACYIEYFEPIVS